MTVTLKIEKNVYGGDGLGRLGDGRVCFVAGAFSGETIRAEIFEQKKNFVRAKLTEIVETSPHRVTPASTVPGMVYAGIDYGEEIRIKQDQLENFLWKVNRSVLPLEVIPADEPLNYRNKVVYHTERRDGKWVIGYREEPSHHVVDTLSDPLACAEINAELPAIRSGVLALLTQGAKTVRRSVMKEENVTIRHTPIDGVKWWFGAPPAGLELHETTLSHRFRVSGDGFYQVNPKVGDKLVRAVRDEYLAGADRAPNVLDLYCGVGVFGLCCMNGASAEARLVGIESGNSAIVCAKRNAEAMGIKANFFSERVGSSLSRIKCGPRHTIIVDPPRGGMEPNVPSWLANRSAARIFYVSCDPATLVRDLAAITKNYEIRNVKLFDMFPRTARFETLVILERKGGSAK